MRVLQVARYGSVRGGAETYLAALCEGLRARGDTVALAYGMEPDHARPEVRDGFAVPAIVEPGGSPGEEAERALEQALEAFEPDVVHVHVPDVWWVAPLCAETAPVLLAVHDHRLHCPVGTKYWAAWEHRCVVRPGPWCLAYNAAARCGSLRANATLRPYRSWSAMREAAHPLRLQVFSRWIRDELARAGSDAERIGVTPYPVPPPAPAEPAVGGDDRPVVLASGRLNKEKGFGALIEALAWIEDPVHLVIAGEGHERENLESATLRAAAAHRITLAGWLSPAALAGWYERAAVVAVPSMWPEPFGIVGLEAMARARPVVAFASGGIAEWLADGETGLAVRPGDVEGLGRAIGRLLADDAERERMGAAGRARAERDFSLAAHVAAVGELYESAAAESPA